ncbi:MAG: Holliday junction branch migration protein RuvA [Candidatus Kapabacteria bacterium]|nr:Holliday junction branch migration protein RuvA [Candidatus Kapabacteria bacterium]
MIARLHGILIEKSTNEVVVDCNGVGYVASVSVATSEVMQLGEKVSVYTYLAVREDALQLFGFATKEERDMFLLLTSISGIGGKIALGLLSAASIKELQQAIVEKNSTFLQRLPGIGKKTAERIVLELQDKVQTLAIGVDKTQVNGGMSFVQSEAVAALSALGYQRAAAEKAVKNAMQEQPSLQWTAESLIRAALKNAAK